MPFCGISSRRASHSAEYWSGVAIKNSQNRMTTSAINNNPPMNSRADFRNFFMIFSFLLFVVEVRAIRHCYRCYLLAMLRDSAARTIEIELAEMPGIEPGTCGLGNRRSVQLSYISKVVDWSYDL